MALNFMSAHSSKFTISSRLIEAGIVLFFAFTAIVVNYKMIRDGIIFESYDLKFHLIWLQHFSKQIAEGIFYPRWLAGDNYGYGSPTFVFYPPLVYYLGSLLKLNGLDAEKTLITLFCLAVFGLGLSFYLYGRSNWGKLPAFAGALFYMSAPYIGFNLYLRGALAETWSLVWLPLVLWISDRAILQSKWRIFLAIIITFIALTHVPSLLICTIFLVFYLIGFLFKYSWKKVGLTSASLFLGFGLAAFYLIPAILEKSLVNIDIMRSDEVYRLNLLGFGLTETTNIVHKYVQPIFLYYCLSIGVIAFLIFLFYRQEKVIIDKTRYWLIVLTILASLTIYPSLPIWESSQTLQMIQFPWRLLGLFSFSVTVLLTTLLSAIFESQRYLKIILSTIIIVILLGNLSYIYKLSLALPGFHNPGNIELAQKKDSWKAAIYEQVKIALYDPYTNKVRGPVEYRPLLKNGETVSDPLLKQSTVSVVKGKAKITISQWESYQRNFQAIVKEASTIKVRTYVYPAWNLFVNNKLYPFEMAKDGAILLKLPIGSYTVEMNYQWTPAFVIGVVVSILSIILLFLSRKYEI